MKNRMTGATELVRRVEGMFLEVPGTRLQDETFMLR
jgi:hypothetical protein